MAHCRFLSAPGRVLALALLATSAALTLAQTKRPATSQNQTRGTAQVAGGYVRFGETYSLKNGVNFAILKAAYTMAPFPSYGGLANTPTEKLVVLDVAVKNWQKTDVDLGSAASMIALYDVAGNKYDGEAQLKSHGVQETYITLKPGQGVGQPALNDPYRVAFRVPLDAEITKVMVNQSRVGKSEEVLRYVLDKSDKAYDPANVIVPLPADVRDASVPSGAVALKEGKATLGAPLLTGPFVSKIEKVERVDGALSEKYTPGEGNRYVVVTLTVTNADLRPQALFDAQPHDTVLKDSDGGSYPVAAWLRSGSLDEMPGGPIEPGASRTMRLLFEVPTADKLVSLNLLGGYYPWKLDL